MKNVLAWGTHKPRCVTERESCYREVVLTLIGPQHVPACMTEREMPVRGGVDLLRSL
jgi:hypothetical protein